MAVASPANLWKLARTVERVFELDEALKEALARSDRRFEAIEVRLTKLEVEQRTVLSEARAAGTLGGSSAAALHVAELSRHLGILQEQVRLLRLATVATQAENLPEG